MNPLAEPTVFDRADMEAVRRAQRGDRDALESLIRRHQSWIYNVALRMVYRREDAEDITQEILLKLITKLSTFDGRSSFGTWMYRIAVNHILNMKRRGSEVSGWTFDRYRRSLHEVEDRDLPDPNTVPADVQLLVDEARISCTSGMLLCLDREQRLVYTLGDIFGVSDGVGATLLEIGRAGFRQKLSRARRDLHSFMQGQCGLVNQANPCRCAKKTRAFMDAGYVDPKNLLFARPHVARVREVAGTRLRTLARLDEAYAEIHRGHPFHDAPDFAASLRALIDGPMFNSALEEPPR
jgi:RNA polymerase sigma factor (sigma-70 family)